VGHGHGSVLGLGATEKRIESEFDPRALGTRKWTSVRTSSGGKAVTDINDQGRAGTVSIVRQRAGRPDEAGTLTRPGPIFDPLGFLLRLRLAPPAATQTFEVLDGHGLWRMTIDPPERQPGKGEKGADGAGGAKSQVTGQRNGGGADAPGTLKLEGKAEPIYWDGQPDPDRHARRFTLWLADDAFRTLLRLVLRVGLGEVRAELVSLERRG
jgi:hypothetical protein